MNSFEFLLIDCIYISAYTDANTVYFCDAVTLSGLLAIGYYFICISYFIQPVYYIHMSDVHRGVYPPNNHGALPPILMSPPPFSPPHHHKQFSDILYAIVCLLTSDLFGCMSR